MTAPIETTPTREASQERRADRGTLVTGAPPARWKQWVRSHPVLAYVTLALGLSWLVWVPGLLLAPTATGLAYVGAFGPPVAGAVMVRAHGGRVRDWLRGIVVMRVPARWYAAALVIPLLQPVAATLVLGATGVPLSMGAVVEQLPTAVVIFVLMLLLGGGQEEPGWRGYLLPLLQARVSPLAASLVIGIVWAVWHLPLFALVADGAPAPSFMLYVPMVVAMSVIFTWLYNHTGSVLLAMLMHAGINTSSLLLPIADLTAVDHKLELAVQAGIGVAIGVLAVVLAVATRGRLGVR